MNTKRSFFWFLFTLAACALGFLSCYKSGQDSNDAGKADATQDSSLLDSGSDADIDSDADVDTDTDADADADTDADADSGMDADIHRPDGGNLIWVKQAGGTGFDQGLAVATAGDVIFITGYYGSEGATFGKDESNQTFLESYGGSDIFLARYNADGTLVWAKRAGGPGGEEGDSVAADENGNVYLVGTFEETCMFGEGEPAQTELTSRGYSDAYIAKFDANGTLVWVQQEGSVSSDYGRSVALLDDGSILVTGRLYGDATFDQGGPYEKTLPMGFFIAKYDSDGNLIWVKGVSDARGAAEAQDIAALPDGSFYVTGYFSAVVFGPGEPNETELSKPWFGDEDIFIAKYDVDGSFLWARKAGGTADYGFEGPIESGKSVTVIPDGTVIIAGEYWGPSIFGKGEPTETLLTFRGDTSFLAKYDPGGEFQWVRSAGGAANFMICGGISYGPGEHVYLSGVFQEEVIWGYGEQLEDKKVAWGSFDVFLSRFSIDGDFQWVKQAGCGGSAYYSTHSSGVTMFSDSSVVLVGDFDELITFGIGEPRQTELASLGGQDVFLARFEK